MGPRKRAKPNPKAEIESSSAYHPKQAQPALPAPSEVDTEQGAARESLAAASSIKLRSEEANTVRAPRAPDKQHSYSGRTDLSQPQSNATWYRGSWSRASKTTPITQVAKETISAAGGAASEAATAARARTPPLSSNPLRSPVASLLRTPGSSRSLSATTTKLNITSSAPIPADGTANAGKTDGNNEGPSQGQGASPGAGTDVVQEKSLNNKGQSTLWENGNKASVPKIDAPEEENSSSDPPRWFMWLSKPGLPTDEKANSRPTDQVDKRGNNTINNISQSTMSGNFSDAQPASTQRRNSEPSPASPTTQGDEQRRSWLGFWGNATTQSNSGSAASSEGVQTNATVVSKTAIVVGKDLKQNKAEARSTAQPSPQPPEPAKSSGWAFWSKEETNQDGQKARGNSEGELALAGSPSQSKPERDVIDESRGIPKKVEKKQRPQSLEKNGGSSKPPSIKNGDKKDKKLDSAAPSPKVKPTTDVVMMAKKEPENLILPSFKNTYQAVEKPGIIEQLSRFFQIGLHSAPKHVELVPNPPRIRRALAIGVHGYFPAPLIRSVLGQPTGTSIRFASSAANAIQKWTQDQGYSCEIEKVALEGEGKITERIDLLWKLMLNWINKIQKADFVMIACHSQGVPVVIMLVAKLIAFGYVNSARVGICAMAGVNLGPFSDYKSRWIGGSAGELFEFAHPDSQVSKDYEAALEVALKFGVRISYIGSIDDQLVSLESSTFGTVTHPYIYRAVFINGRVHSPDFLSHLVGFALKLRNLGISDHGVIRELSSPLAGSLYTGEGHSKIYEDENVYHLAVEHSLETTYRGHVPSMRMQRDGSPSSQNPYILPFAMRGVLEEDYVRTELYDEITELIKQFDDWKPSRQVLKDVKFRLEGVRSKL